MTLPPYDAVVLAGGRSRRMQGADKTRLVLGDRSLLDRVLAAVVGAQRIVVVGPQHATATPVTWVREDPPGSGPAAALAVGLTAVTSDLVILLAADLPFVSVEHVEHLVRSLTGDGVVVVDDEAHEQWLFSAWRTEALRRLSLLPDHGVRDVLASLRPATIRLRTDGPKPWFDCDTPDDVQRAEEMLP